MRRSSFVLLAPAAALSLALAACDAGSKPGETPADSGPHLSFTAPRMDQVFEGEKVEVLFDLRNYEIGMVDAGKNGQHLHLIVDNEPYKAIYDVSNAITLDPKLLTEGTHVLRAFPSAGPKDAHGAVEHESRKNPGAYAWVRFHVKHKGGPLAEFDASAPLLTYSRPKGEYKVGSPNQTRFLVDFYVNNAKLGKGDYSVVASLDGKKIGEYFEWTRIFADTPPAAGDHVMTLELFDREGKAVAGPFNKTERKFKVVP